MYNASNLSDLHAETSERLYTTELMPRKPQNCRAENVDCGKIQAAKILLRKASCVGVKAKSRFKGNGKAAKTIKAGKKRVRPGISRGNGKNQKERSSSARKRPVRYADILLNLT
jgi:hypothetical protein